MSEAKSESEGGTEGSVGTPFTISVRASVVKSLIDAPELNFRVKVRHPSMDYTIPKRIQQEMMKREKNAQKWRKKTGR
jgi:hypothetical protein